MKFLSLILFLISVGAYAAETALTVTSLSETAVAIPYESVDDSNGNKAYNPNGDLFLLIRNPGASSATVTVTAQETTKEDPAYGTLTKSDNTIALTAGQEKVVGPFKQRAYNDSSSNIIISITGTGAADVDIAAMKP